jgi:hypothetical protein
MQDGRRIIFIIFICPLSTSYSVLLDCNKTFNTIDLVEVRTNLFYNLQRMKVVQENRTLGSCSKMEQVGVTAVGHEW